MPLKSVRNAERPGAAMNTKVLDNLGSQVGARLRAAIARSRHPMLIADDERRWVSANAAACNLLGFTHADIAWRTVDECASPAERRRLEDQWGGFLVSGAAEGWYELRVRDRGMLVVEFSAIAGVMPGRHLLVFIPVEEAATAANVTTLHTPAWAPVVSTASGRSRLTKREREIMTLIAAGGQNSDIATRLFLSPETVKSHAQNAMAKLRAHTRAHAVAIALVTGEIVRSIPSGPGEAREERPRIGGTGSR